MEKNFKNKDILLKYEKFSFNDFLGKLDNNLKENNDIHKIIFNEDSQEPIMRNVDNNISNKENFDMKNCYIISSIQKNKLNENEFRRNSGNINNFYDSFDKRKRKLSDNDRKKYAFKKNNLNLSFNHIVSISIINNEIYFNNELNIKTKEKEIEKIDIDEFFEDETKYSSDPKIVDIDKIYLVNKYLNIDKNKPLWYIYHLIAKSSFGPLSSEQIYEMYKSNIINGLTLIRLIDIFSIDNVETFNYIKLKEIERKIFYKKIKISSLLKETNLNKV